LFLKIKEPDSRLFYFCFVPVAAGVFDYIENLFIVGFITGHPDISSGLVGLSSLATIIKSALTTLFFVVLTIVGVTCFVKKGRG